MKKILLDTHAFIWMCTGSERLSVTARDTILDARSRLHLSVASWWEIGVKISIGKLDLHPRWATVFKREMQNNEIAWLPVHPEHCEQVATLPFHHRDPFDRMLIAQAQQEKMTILSADENMRGYNVKVVW